MRPSDSQRRVVLGALLLGTLAASAWVHRQSNAEPQIVAMAQPQRVSPLRQEPTEPVTNEAIPILDLAALQARKEMADTEDEADIDSDLFAAQSWYVPPPPPKPQPLIAPPAPPPSAPALPFTYMGKLEDGDRLGVYLAKGERAYSVRIGDTIEGIYRLESMDNGQIVFTYLPMSIKQTLEIGS